MTDDKSNVTSLVDERAAREAHAAAKKVKCEMAILQDMADKRMVRNASITPPSSRPSK